MTFTRWTSTLTLEHKTFSDLRNLPQRTNVLIKRFSLFLFNFKLINFLFSDSSNELVSCDSCGFYTHEGCYGIADTESKITSDSSASTEPWFCDSCLHLDTLDMKKTSGSSSTNTLKCFTRPCELCPNVECGLMKETENGKFVHIVCALYTPGKLIIPFQDELFCELFNLK